MARKKPVSLSEIESDIRTKFDLVLQITTNPESVKKPPKEIKTLLSSIRQYRTDALNGSIAAYKVFKINGYDMRFSRLTDMVKNRLRSFSSLPLEKLKVA